MPVKVNWLESVNEQKFAYLSMTSHLKTTILIILVTVTLRTQFSAMVTVVFLLFAVLEN